MATSGLINIGGSSPTTELLQYSSVAWETATVLMATVPANGWTATYANMAVVPIGTVGMTNNDPFALLSGNTWVIKKAGKYSLHGVLGLTTPDAASVAIGKNGVQYKRIHIDPNNATAAIGSIDFDLGDLVINDIIEIRIVTHSTTDLLKGISLTLEQKPTAIAPVVDTVAEYGSATLAISVTANESAGSWISKLVSVTLPTAGTYRVSWQASAEIGDNGTTQTVLSGRLFNTTDNVALAQTRHIICGNDNEAAVQTNTVGTGAGEQIITIDGLKVITFQTKIDALASAVVLLLGDSALNGNTHVSYEKIAGQLPSQIQTWTDYIPTVTSTTGTNPTLPTSAVINASYTVSGKVMTLNFKYFAATTTGGADGTQSYKYSMPAGFTIDTSKAVIPTVLTNTSGSGLDGGTIGTGFGRNSSLSAGLGVVPLSTTSFGFYFEGATRLVGAGALAATGAANTTIWATLQIPIL